MIMEKQLAKIDALLKRLPPAVQLLLDGVTTRHTFRKGDYLLRQGDVCQYNFVIETGLARKYYLMDGREITTDFYFPSDLALSMTSYITRQPGDECIQALDTTTVSRTSYQAFNALKADIPMLAELDLLLTEYYVLWQEERLREFRTLDATQRYENLLSTQPHWSQRLPLTHLASYLGVSLETLSRIRAKRAKPANRI